MTFGIETVRTRLTLWYVAAMVIVLTVYAAGVFGFVRRSVSDALDARVRSDFTWAVEMWEQRPDGTVTWFDADDVAKAADLNQDEDNPWLQVWTPEGELLFQTAVARFDPPHPGATSSTRSTWRPTGAVSRPGSR